MSVNNKKFKDKVVIVLFACYNYSFFNNSFFFSIDFISFDNSLHDFLIYLKLLA